MWGCQAFAILAALSLGHAISDGVDDVGFVQAKLQKHYRAEQNLAEFEAKKMNNVGYIGRGYDIYKGNPHEAGAIDPGFRRPIFQVTYKDGKVSPDDRYQVPDRMSILGVPSCSSKIENKDVSSGKAFKDSLTFEVSGSVNAASAKFTAGAQYKNIVSETAKGQNHFEESKKQCSVYTVQIDTGKWPQLTEGFVASLARLPAAFNDNPKAFYDLIGDYGTHVTTEVGMGGRLGFREKLDKETYNKNKERGFGANAHADFEASAPKPTEKAAESGADKAEGSAEKAEKGDSSAEKAAESGSDKASAEKPAESGADKAEGSAEKGEKADSPGADKPSAEKAAESGADKAEGSAEKGEKADSPGGASISGEGKGNFEWKSEQSRDFSNSKGSKSSFSQGGKYSKDPSVWEDSLKDDPFPITYGLKYLYEVIMTETLPANTDLQVQEVVQALKEALDSYCEGRLVASGDLQTCDPPLDLPPFERQTLQKWATMTMDKNPSHEDEACQEDSWVDRVRFYEQGGYGVVGLEFHCVGDGEDDSRILLKAIAKNGEPRDWVDCASGFTKMQGKEQGRYGVVDGKVMCEGRYHTLVNNEDGDWTNNVLQCPDNQVIVGFATAKYENYGMTDFTVTCSNAPEIQAAKAASEQQ